MQQSLTEISEIPHYIGDQKISPVAYFSIELLNKFILSTSFTKKENILWLGFPNRKSSTPLLALGVLVNLFEQDIKKAQKRNDLRKGMKVSFFKTELAEFRSLSASYLHIIVNRRQHNGYRWITEKIEEHVPAFYAEYCTPYLGNRTKLSTLKKILTKARERMGTVKAIDKLLIKENLEENRVPSGHLRSQIMVLTGRNSKKKVVENFRNIHLFGTEATEIFEDHLIIQKDPEDLEFFFSQDAAQKRGKFNNYFINKLRNFAENNDQYTSEIENIIDNWKNWSYKKEELLELQALIKYHVRELPDFFHQLIKNLPDDNPIPKFLKLILVSSPETYLEYQNTLNGVSQMGVKVCILFEASDYLSIPPTAFQGHQRFFWNRNKLNILKNSKENYIDSRWYEKNLKFSRQNLNIYLYDDRELNTYYWKAYHLIRDLDGYENLKNFFWRGIFPSFHILKNSPEIRQETLDSIASDLEIQFVEMRNYLPKESLYLLENYLEAVRKFDNSKKLEDRQAAMASQEISLKKEIYVVPVGTVNKIPVEQVKENLFLGGVPFRDFENNEIQRFLLEKIIPDVHIQLWPGEYFTLIQKLNRFIQSSLFQDFLYPEVVDKLEIYFPLQKDDLQTYYTIHDRRTDKNRDPQPSQEVENEKELGTSLAEYRHSVYKGNKESYTKHCFVAELRGNRWIYIPRDDSSYIFTTTGTSITEIKNKNLKNGSVLVLFRLSKEDIRRSGESDQKMDAHFSVLEIWDNTLKELYISCGSNYTRLKKRLEEVKKEYKIEGSPEEYNLKRWLNDQDLTLLPRIDNLQMILAAGGKSHKLEAIQKAGAVIRKYERRLRYKVQKEVAEQADVFFDQDEEIFRKSVLVYNVEVYVTTCRIKNINSKVLEIEAIHVGKILGEEC